MPPTFKNRATDTDAPFMSDIATNETTANQAVPNLLLDGELPRLGSAQPILPGMPAPSPSAPDASGSTLPVVSPVLSLPRTAPGMGALASLPSLPAQSSGSDSVTPSLPTLPPPASTPSVTLPATAPANTVTDPQPTAAVGATPHPMAHLMPEKAAQSEASRRAAEARAAKKAKAKKVKLGVAAGMLVFAAAVGPPLGKWFVNALNEAGSTKTEEPAPAPTTAPAAGAIGAIDDAKQAVDATSEQSTPAP
jgi:hypothetical protein